MNPVVTGEVVLRDKTLFRVVGVRIAQKRVNLAELLNPRNLLLGIPIPDAGQRLCLSNCGHCRGLTWQGKQLTFSSAFTTEGMPVRWQTHYDKWRAHAAEHGWEVPGKDASLSGRG